VLGIGTAVFAVVYTLFNYLQIGNYFNSSTVGSRLKSLRLYSGDAKSAKSDREQHEGNMTLASALGGAAFGVLLTLGTGAILIAGIAGSALGTAVSWFVRYSVREARKTEMMRELAVLYEIIDFFTQGEGEFQHFTILQALRYGAVITPAIRPVVQRCIDAWPSGPVRALENFAKEVNLPEASILTSVLIHAEKSGMKYARSAMSEGSRDLENLRQMLAEIKIGSKPMYYMIYRMLPLAGVVGIVVGALFYHLMTMLSQFFSF
jgi:Flp pilus assembly protein TadB